MVATDTARRLQHGGPVQLRLVDGECITYPDYVYADIAPAHPCCDKARVAQCVCIEAVYCPDHGTTHRGSHE